MNSISTPPPPENRVVLGNAVKIRGLRGDLKIVPQTWRHERFYELEGCWFLLSTGEIHYFTFKRIRVEGGMVYIRLDECPTRELAEPVIGAELFIDESRRDKLPEDMYYYDDLEGCTVHCERHGDLGVIKAIISGAAQDIWQVEGQSGEVLIPAVKEFVRKVDIQTKKIEVNLPEGIV